MSDRFVHLLKGRELDCWSTGVLASVFVLLLINDTCEGVLLLQRYILFTMFPVLSLKNIIMSD